MTSRSGASDSALNAAITRASVIVPRRSPGGLRGLVHRQPCCQSDCDVSEGRHFRFVPRFARDPFRPQEPGQLGERQRAACIGFAEGG